MYIKIHETPEQRNIIALCDKALIGKTLTQGEIELKVSEKFYKGEELNEDKLSLILKGAINLNVLGEKAIAFALKCGVISENNIIKIQGVPHAQSTSS
ncbi:MAG: DUF424 family protein [Candidatus Nanoarchaeia archaeon]|nr:DUF424 family protein [Candidatus Nanoarchaeia archaeon]